MRTFLVSDTHFGHEGVCRFLKNDGSKLRPWDNASEMDSALIENWNSVVKPEDKVYHLGDVCFSNRILGKLGMLNGRKVLIKGNHDTLKPSQYLRYFKDIRAYHVLDKFILSHIPIHPHSISRFTANIHGHTHAYRIDDPRYEPVCVEHTDYAPIEFDVVKKRILERLK